MTRPGHSAARAQRRRQGRRRGLPLPWITGRLAAPTVAWGRNDYGQTNIPFGASSSTVAIAAGGYHCVGLTTDRRVVAWGAGTQNTGVHPHYGQSQRRLRLPPTARKHWPLRQAVIIVWRAEETASSSPGELARLTPACHALWPKPRAAGISDIAAIACGAFHSLVLQYDGKVIAWGDNSRGQTNVPGGLSKVVAIAAGAFHNLAVKSDGRVVAWGDNSRGSALCRRACRTSWRRQRANTTAWPSPRRHPPVASMTSTTIRFRAGRVFHLQRHRQSGVRWQSGKPSRDGRHDAGRGRTLFSWATGVCG